MAEFKRGRFIMNAISGTKQMHKDISLIFSDKRRRTFEYVEDFIKRVSQLIEKLDIFSFHIVWECIDQLFPGFPYMEEQYLLKNVTPHVFRSTSLLNSNSPVFFQEYYIKNPLDKNRFRQKFVDYFKKKKLDNVIKIPISKEYSYINLPVFSDQQRMPQWIITLVLKEEVKTWCNDQVFIEILEHLSQQLGLAFDKFQEIAAAQILGKIDASLGGEEKTDSDSTLNQLKIIANILARKYQTEWCGFFLADEQKNILKLETGNVNFEFPIIYSLNDLNKLMVNCFKNGHIIRLHGRENVEKFFSTEDLKQLEKGLRYIKKKELNKTGKQHFTPYILFEHVLLFPIAFGGKRLGVTAVFSGKKVPKTDHPDKYDFTTRPFSQFETLLLAKVQRNVFNIFVSHEAVQKRLQDIKHVIRPVSEVITMTENALSNNKRIINPNVVLKQVNNLSRIATQYVQNFEKLLDLDSNTIKLKKNIIPDLRMYLINFARLYTPLIRPKCISINVTRKTPNDIAIKVCKEYFDLAISNLIDNTVKYSFNPEERFEIGLQAKPRSTESIENVLITAYENEREFIITISNYGPEFNKGEKNWIFSRGFRSLHGIDRAEGAGVGLFLTKEIIELHSGSIIIVPNTPKYNSTFKITLPKHKVSPSALEIAEAKRSITKTIK